MRGRLGNGLSHMIRFYGRGYGWSTRKERQALAVIKGPARTPPRPQCRKRFGRICARMRRSKSD